MSDVFLIATVAHTQPRPTAVPCGRAGQLMEADCCLWRAQGGWKCPDVPGGAMSLWIIEISLIVWDIYSTMLEIRYKDEDTKKPPSWKIMWKHYSIRILSYKTSVSTWAMYVTPWKVKKKKIIKKKNSCLITWLEYAKFSLYEKWNNCPQPQLP